jgi:methionine--tRNA ligase beta chain
MIVFEDFKKLEIKIGTIVSAEKVEGADKLLKLLFDFGGTESVQILSGIAEFYDPLVLVGKQVPVIVNLEPRTLKRQVSNGMILAVVVDEKPILLHPDKSVPPGSLIR